MKIWLSFLVLLIPLSMMLNVHQSKRYLQTRAAISLLQRKQNRLLEENQRIIAQIARNSAPTTIERLAQSREADLRKTRPDQVLRIIIPEENNTP